MRGCFLKKDKRAKPDKEDASVTAMLTAIRDKAGGRSREGPFPKMWPLVEYQNAGPRQGRSPAPPGSVPMPTAMPTAIRGFPSQAARLDPEGRGAARRAGRDIPPQDHPDIESVRV